MKTEDTITYSMDDILHIKHLIKVYIMNTIQITNIVKKTCAIFIEKNQTNLVDPQ